MSAARDERGVVAGFLLRTVVALAVAAVVLFDAGAVAVNVFSLDSSADEIASALSTDVAHGRLQGTYVRCVRSGPKTGLCAEAASAARAAGARLVRFEISPDGALHLRLRRRAETLIAGRIRAFDEWRVATADGRATTQ